MAAERDRPDVARRRAGWTRFQARIDPRRLVFVDETWTRTNMAPLRGWGPKGERVPGQAPFGNRNTTTFIAALRWGSVQAPRIIEGPINGATFCAWLEEVLLPTLRRGDLVVLDNLRVHKSDAARALVQKAGARLVFLPPYSPDLNPIEMLFSKLKHLLRQAGERTRETLWRKIGELLSRFSPQECENYITHAGYVSTAA